MEQIIKVIILGIVEGVTEFLPVSSTGHLILVGNLLNFKGSFAVLFEVVIQLGAILAVIFYYKERILASLTKLRPGQEGFSLWLKVFVAFLPSAIIGFLIKDFIEEKLFTPSTVAFALVFGAILILLVEKWGLKQKINSMDGITYKQALLIGIAQCMALFPGMSRSASTIIGGILVGMTLTGAAEFSFFLAIPTMLAATALSLFTGVSELTQQNWIMLGVGFAISFVTAQIVVDRFIVFLKKHSLRPFAYYRLLIGVLMAIYFMA